MTKATKKKLFTMLNRVSRGFDYYQEHEFEDENASDKFWSEWSKMYEFIESLETGKE